MVHLLAATDTADGSQLDGPCLWRYRNHLTENVCFKTHLFWWFCVKTRVFRVYKWQFLMCKNNAWLILKCIQLCVVSRGSCMSSSAWRSSSVVVYSSVWFVDNVSCILYGLFTKSLRCKSLIMQQLYDLLRQLSFLFSDKITKQYWITEKFLSFNVMAVNRSNILSSVMDMQVGQECRCFMGADITQEPL